MEHQVELLRSQFVTHDVRTFLLTRPRGLEYEPGQGVELALDLEGWRDEGRPFTPTSLRDDGLLEFTIKAYPEHDGVTRRLHELEAGARLHMSEAFGTITYQGPGVFLAGGAGVTPFLAILRTLHARGELEGSSMIFSNKTPADVICEKELRHYLGDDLLLTCTRESGPGTDDRRIDRTFLEETVDHFDQRFYLCGPPAFVDDLEAALRDLGARADGLIFEE